MSTFELNEDGCKIVIGHYGKLLNQEEKYLKVVIATLYADSNSENDELTRKFNEHASNVKFIKSKISELKSELSKLV